MKPLRFALLTALVAAFGVSAYADIQAPPASQMGPTRKLGRGLANIAFCYTELAVTWDQVNESEGNSAAWTYGVVKGLGRTLFRFGAGIYDVTTFPVATYKQSYRAPYEANTPWKLNTYTEFPPEVGWESRLDYCTINTSR